MLRLLWGTDRLDRARGEEIDVISIGDVVKAIISEQEFMIEQLEHHITGGYFWL